MVSVRQAVVDIWKGAPSRPKLLNAAASEPSTPATRTRIAPPLPSQYPPLILLHTLLLPFSLFLLPHTPVPTPLTVFFPPSNSPNARNLDHPQPAFLNPLTADPVRTLVWAVVGAGPIIAWWSGWVREWVAQGSMGGRGVQGRLQDKLNQKEHGDGGKRVDIWNAWVFTGYVAMLYNVVLILFGAPISSYLPHTALLSILLSLLTVFIPAYALGPPVLPLPFLFHRSHDNHNNSAANVTSSSVVIQNDIWVRIFAERDLHTPAERAMLYPAVGALVGAWVGVIPIGLDWDRPWQAYPLPPAYLAAAGYVTGALSALVVSSILYLAALESEEAADEGTSDSKEDRVAKSAAAKKNAKAKERERRKKGLKGE